MIERIILLVAVIVFCISLFSLVRIALEYKKGTDTYAGIEDAVVTQNTSDTSGDTDAQSDTEGEGPEQVNIPYVNMESLKQINPDSEGWLLFPDTKINYPVVYGRDNAYYLTRMIDGTANKAGTLFTDMNNGKGFSDRNTIIYGHNMKNGSMFGQLKKYGKEEYYQEHPSFYLYTEAGVWRYDIFSVRVVDEASDSYTINFASEEEFNTYIDKAFRTSMYDTGVAVTASDTIVTLSTCTSKDTDRLIVQGVRGEQIR